MKNVVITGGSSGIGFETAKMFSEKNQVFILDIKNNSMNLKNIHFYKCDVGNLNEVEKQIKKITSKFGHIDILINCAGIQTISSFENYNYKDWNNIMQTNYFGVCNTISSCLKHFNNNSTVLNIISVHSSVPRTNKYAYDSSKSAIEMLTKELALELASKKITVNSLAFGAVNTNMNAGWSLEEQDQARRKVPLRIIFEPDEIASFIYTIINSFSKYTTGSTFTIDGGRSLL